jgi:tripartite-type tricarboxylate transporter receptor subunit TctC
MEKQKVRVCFTVIVVMIIFSLYNIAAAAVTPDFGFFKGRIITYIVATQPGGGYDTYARVIGKYIQKHIPGSTVIVKNIPGAGNIIGANELYLAKPNGLTIGTFNTGLLYSQIVGSQGIRFDLAKYSWIGKASAQARVFCVVANSPYKTFKDILDSKEPVKMSATGVGGSDYNESLLLAAATGAPLKVIPGYSGRENEMAMLRGEVVGQLGSYQGLIGFLKAKEGRVLLQMGAKRHKELQDVPMASEMDLSAKNKQIIAIIDSMAELGRLTAAPPKMPQERLEVLRIAYKKALTDKALITELERIGLDTDPSFGEDVANLVKKAVNQPPENIALMKRILKVD